MKKIHYVNLGYGRSGSTWLFDNLIKYPHIDYCGIKENRYLEFSGYPMDEYIQYYLPYDVSLSFSPGQVFLDSKQFCDLDRVTTHFSVLLRNPYEVCKSLYNQNYNSP
jgi:hypothetical protein